METKVISLFPQMPDQSQTVRKTFMEVFRLFNVQDAIDKKHKKGTVFKYENFANNFERFLQDIGKPDLTIDEMKIPIIKEFVRWLPENLSHCDRTHISKHIYRINKAINSAVIDGIIPYNACAAYVVKRGPNKKVINLDSKEFNEWVNHKWHLDIYKTAQDYFIMQMTAGLSYMDIFHYKTITDSKGVWIESNRGKTNRPFYIPLWHPEFSLALQIHEKYNGKIPPIECHLYNNIIREMAAQLGIQKYLTSHIGRKTFATLKDENGWPIGPIASMMGITDRVCEDHYINKSRKRIDIELSKRA